jgi:hypothetical protein
LAAVQAMAFIEPASLLSRAWHYNGNKKQKMFEVMPAAGKGFTEANFDQGIRCIPRSF